jgi:glycosyltransferase involved in cell wall biosynthesis
MRIVYVSPVGTLGGAERLLLTAMAAVKRAGHDVRLISCADGPLLEHAAKLGVPAAAVPMPRLLATTGESGGAARALLRGLVVAPLFWRYARRLRRAIDALAPDVVHSNGLRVHVFLGLARPTAPVVWHLHDFIGSRRLMSKALRRLSKHAARAIAISRAVRDDATPVLAPLPVDVVMNAIDVARFAPAPDHAGFGAGRDDPDPSMLDTQSDLPAPAPGTLRIGLIATYARWKGQDLFLRAAARVRQLRPDLPLRFYVIGGPIYRTKGSQWSRDELADLAKSLGLDAHVAFVPFQPDAAPVYRALDVVVHASTQREPFGLTIVEAMASRRAVIVARAGGAAEIVSDGFDALTFTPGDADDLAGKILDLAADPARRSLLASAARATAVNEFSDARLGAELVAVYRRAVDQK